MTYRTTPPAPQIEKTADRVVGEERRRAIHVELKTKRAKVQIEGRRRDELDQEMLRVEGELDALEAQHANDCAPLQAELSQIDGKEIEMHLAGLEPDPALADRRRQIGEELRKENFALESAVAEKNADLAQIRRERYAAAIAAAEDFTVDLFRSGLPELVAAARSADTARQWGDRRARAIEERASEVARSGQRLSDGDRLYLEAERAAACRALAEAIEAHDRAYSLAVETD